MRVFIYKEGQGGEPLLTIRLSQAREGKHWAGLWTAQVLSLPGSFYLFQVRHKGQWLVPTPGIKARAVGVGGERGALLSMTETDPPDWHTDTFATTPVRDAIIYETHLRDLTQHPSSGVPPEHRGKFLGLADKARYLRSLGVTHIHLLPAFDFGSVDETELSTPQYNWGYDPVHYNVPEGSYATDPYRPEVRIREFKTMVQTLHREGLALIFDIVFNHVADAGTSSFERTVPGYFFRTRPDGSLSNASGCGNETASERPMMRRFMVESLLYWMREYHVDGFRIDLMGTHDIETMRTIREAVQNLNPHALLYGEGWTAGPPALPTERLALKSHMRHLPGVAAYSDEIRDALRGTFTDDSRPGLLGGSAEEAESLKFGLTGCVSHPQVDMSRVNYCRIPWAGSPAQMIAYVSCHDDMCLCDRLLASVPETKDVEVLERLSRLAHTAVMTSQGIPLLFCGEEVMRSKSGIRNSYRSPDSVNAIDWSPSPQHTRLQSYCRELINLRRRHPGFRLPTAEHVRRHLEFLPVQKEGVVAYRLHNLDEIGDCCSTLLVVLNTSSSEVVQPVPPGDYIVLLRDSEINAQGLGTFHGSSCSIPARSALILSQY